MTATKPVARNAANFNLMAFAMAGVFVLFYAVYIFRHSDFTNDDLDSLLLMRNSAFWSFLVTPIDVHFVPMHRLLTVLVYWLSPMNFGITVFISTGLHIATIVYLYRLLRLLDVGQASWLVVCCYAISVVPFFGMIWWAHAEHRFPYVFFAVYAAFHYLTWLRQGGRWHFLACVIAFFIGLGFYEKMVLLPAQMVAFGLFWNPRKFVTEWRHSMAIPFFIGILSLVYVVLYLSLKPQAGHVSIVLAVEAIVEFIKMLGISITGVSLVDLSPTDQIGWSGQALFSVILWSAVFIFSVVRCRRSFWIWLGLLGILCLDYLPIALSNRVYLYAFVIAHQYRFGFEELFVVAIFLGLVLREILPVTELALAGSRRRLAACLIVVFYAVSNILGLHFAIQQNLAIILQNDSHRYMRNLRHDISRLNDSSAGFEYSPLPRYMSIFDLVHDAGSVLQLFEPTARIGLTKQVADYWISDDGHIHREPHGGSR